MSNGESAVLGNIGSVENHRERERGVLVYPVYSRRSGGLSVGINLFPGTKICSFGCPYCEVFPFSAGAVFSSEQMEKDLAPVIEDAIGRNIMVKDICFSGNGEPSMSPHFPEALVLAAKTRDAMAPSAELVLITNGTGLLDKALFSLLHEAVKNYRLDIWLKLDAGTPGWYRKINASEISFNELAAAVKNFIACTPVTIQTMLCAVNREAPPPEEAAAWEKLLMELNNSGGIRKVQIYGKARPSPDDPIAEALPEKYLDDRAESLRRAFSASKNAPRVEVFP